MALLCQELASLSLSFVSVQNNESDVDHHESLLPTTYKKKKKKSLLSGASSPVTGFKLYLLIRQPEVHEAILPDLLFSYP